MGLIASDKSGGDFAMTPEGTYIGRCIKIVDLGTQKGSEIYGGKDQHKVMLSWELLNEDSRMEDGRPFSISKFYTVSLHEKAILRQHLEAWRGKRFTDEELNGFDLSKVAGTYCMIQVVHSPDGKYANVNAIMSTKEKPKGVNQTTVFDIENPDMEVFEAMSDNMKAKIMAAPEWPANKPKAAAVQTKTAKQTETTKPEDVVITDFGDEPIDLNDIPF